MGCNRKGKVAEMPVELDWQILRISRSINHGKAIFAYISTMRVSESICWLCLKSKILSGKVILLINCLSWT
jgi:hypothetical protein